jgi:hypothetical protein
MYSPYTETGFSINNLHSTLWSCTSCTVLILYVPRTFPGGRGDTTGGRGDTTGGRGDTTGGRGDTTGVEGGTRL